MMNTHKYNYTQNNTYNKDNKQTHGVVKTKKHINTPRQKRKRRDNDKDAGNYKSTNITMQHTSSYEAKQPHEDKDTDKMESQR